MGELRDGLAMYIYWYFVIKCGLGSWVIAHCNVLESGVTPCLVPDTFHASFPVLINSLYKWPVQPNCTCFLLTSLHMWLGPSAYGSPWNISLFARGKKPTVPRKVFSLLIHVTVFFLLISRFNGHVWMKRNRRRSVDTRIQE